MSTNKQLVEKLIKSFNTLDHVTLWDILTDDVKHTANGTAFGTDLKGKEAYVQYMRNVFDRFKSIEFRPLRIYEDVDFGTVVLEWEGEFTTAKDIYYASRGVFVVDVIEGKIDWVRDYFDTEKTKTAHS